MKKCFATVAILAAIATAASGAQPGVFKTTTDNGREVTVTVVNDDIIKVTNAPRGAAPAPSRASVLAPAAFTGKSVSLGDVTGILTADGISVALNNATGAVTITSAGGAAVTDNGLRATQGSRQRLELTTTGSGSFYGAGERGHALKLNGDTLVMYNKQNYGYTKGEKRISQMNITMPLFLSTEGYALVFDDYAAAEMILSDPIVYLSESDRPISYYFVKADGDGSLKSLTRRLSSLTGRQDLPPFWAMGYITSKYGYKTQAETTGVIDTLKMKGYPVDGVVLDLYWYGKEEDMGRLEWDKEQWPDHRKMLADLRARGVNTITISQPYILQNGRGVDNYNYLDSKGLMVKDSTGATQPVTIWVGHGGMFDVSNPDTRRWLPTATKP
jgi:alpha-glucosidase (family GH31 glycosyl hydrolase)